MHTHLSLALFPKSATMHDAALIGFLEQSIDGTDSSIPLPLLQTYPPTAAMHILPLEHQQRTTNIPRE